MDDDMMCGAWVTAQWWFWAWLFLTSVGMGAMARYIAWRVWSR